MLMMCTRHLKTLFKNIWTGTSVINFRCNVPQNPEIPYLLQSNFSYQNFRISVNVNRNETFTGKPNSKFMSSLSTQGFHHSRHNIISIKIFISGDGKVACEHQPCAANHSKGMIDQFPCHTLSKCQMSLQPKDFLYD